MAKEKHELNDVVLGEGKYASENKESGASTGEADSAAGSDGAEETAADTATADFEAPLEEVEPEVDDQAIHSLMGSIFSSQ